MLASELIKQLEKLIKKHSDLDITVYNPYGESCEDNFENINIAHVDGSLVIEGYWTLLWSENDENTKLDKM